MWVRVHKLAQFCRRVGGDPTRAGVLAVFQTHIAVVLGFQAVLHHLKLQLTHGAQQHGAAGFGLEHLNGTFLAQLVQALLQLLGAQWVFQNHRHEHLGCKKGQAGKLQRRSVGDGVTQLHAAMCCESDDVTSIGFVHRFAPL